MKEISCCCCCCCCCVCMLCSTVVMRRVSINDTGTSCAVRTWGVLCGVGVGAARSPVPEPRVLLLLCRNKRSTEERCCCCCYVYVCSVLYGSHGEGVNRRHRGALWSAYVGRAVPCACGSITRPRARGQGTTRTGTTSTSLKQTTKQRGAAQAAVDKVHGAVIDIAAEPCHMPLSAFSATSLRYGPVTWAVRS